MVAILQNWRVESAGILNPGNRSVDAGSDRLLVYVVGIRSPGDTLEEILTVSWGGRSLTRIDHLSTTSTSLGESHYSAWYLKDEDIALASGTAFTVTRSSGNSIQYRAYSATFVDVDQDNPIFDFDHSLGTGGTPAAGISIDTDIDGYVFAQWLGDDQNGGTQDVSWSGLTEALADFTNTQIYSSLAVATASGSSISVSGTPTNNRDTILGVVSLRNSAAEPEPINLDGSLNVGAIGLISDSEIVNIVSANGSISTGTIGLSGTGEIVTVVSADGSLNIGTIGLTLNGEIIPSIVADSSLNIGDVLSSLDGAIIPSIPLDGSLSTSPLGGVFDAEIVGVVSFSGTLDVNDIDLVSTLQVLPSLLVTGSLDVGVIQGNLDGSVYPVRSFDGNFDILPNYAVLEGTIIPSITGDGVFNVGAIETILGSSAAEGVLLNGTFDVSGIDLVIDSSIVPVISLDGQLPVGGINYISGIGFPILADGSFNISDIAVNGGITFMGTIAFSQIEIVPHTDIVSIVPMNTPIIKDT